MLLSHHHLHHLVADGILENALVENINPASIDVRLGNTILHEGNIKMPLGPIDISQKESLAWNEFVMGPEDYYILMPGEFILAQTIEVFNLPDYIAGEFRLKSTAARNGLDQALAVWLDPGWHGSVLTVELRNNSRRQALVLRPGQKIGQVIFYLCYPVPSGASYSVRGQYNNDLKAQGGKELR
jgi:dCTP deaminase